MAKKYKFLRVDLDTYKNIINKQKRMNAYLKEMGIKKEVKKIGILKELSKRQLFLSDNELKNISRRCRKI